MEPSNKTKSALERLFGTTELRPNIANLFEVARDRAPAGALDAANLKMIQELVASHEAEHKAGFIPTGSVMIDGVVMSGDFSRMFGYRGPGFQQSPRLQRMMADYQAGREVTGVMLDTEFVLSPEEWAKRIREAVGSGCETIEIDSLSMIKEK